MRWPRWQAGVIVALALIGLGAAGLARRQLVDLTPEDYTRSVRRFTAGVREVEIDPRLPWVRIPWVLPGPGDAWAGGVAHAVTFRLEPRRRRLLMLFLDVEGALPPSWDPLAHNAVDIRPALIAPASVSVAVQGRTLPTEVRRSHSGVRRRYRVRVPVEAFGDGADTRLSVTNESGPALVLDRVRLEERVPTFAWAHLGRPRLPRESAIFLAASLGTLLLWNATGGGWVRRLITAVGPATGLVLLGVAALGRGPSAIIDTPRWLWALLPLLLLAFRPRRPGQLVRRPAKALLGNAVLALTALVVSLGAAELILRFAFRPVTSAGDTRTYFQRTPARFNSLGFDERDFPVDRPPHQYRIAFLGDSLSLSAPHPDRYANVIARLLNETRTSDVTFEAVSFAKGGTDTEEQLSYLRRFVWQTQPDFVVLQWYVNDVELGVKWERPYSSPLIPWEKAAGVLLRTSAFYSLLQGQWEFTQTQLGLIRTYPEYMHERFGDPEGQGSLAAVGAVRELIEECQGRGVPVSIVLFPHIDETLSQGTYRYAYLHERVLQLCRERQITCVDLSSTFGAYADYKQLWVNRLDPHPNALAHRLAAQRVMEALGAFWREGRPRTSVTAPRSG